ncbi:MAG: thioredoxin family protein [Erysipelotrichaceae bacterium]|nr:thioredoxin family protein [Erysipelotrichaceae bacterium]
MLKIFYLKNCPYCKKAQKYLDIHRPDFPNIMIQMIEESEQAELANQYDYYYVPSYFYNEEKLHEGAITEEELLNILKSIQKSL